MVTLAVNTIEQWARPCFARPKLLEAQDALSRGDLIAAGCLLREAARRFLHSQCEYHRCLPSKRKQQSAGSLAHALHHAGHCDDGSHSWIVEIVETGNSAAHCRPVKAATLETCISLLHSLLDSATGYSEYKRNGGAL
jgi:hypothetical protein